MRLVKAMSSALVRSWRSVRRLIAALWNYWYRTQFKLRQYRIRYGGPAVLAILFLASLYLSPNLQAFLNSQYATKEATQALQGLLLNTGAALIGATAIVTSLVLFAMQVNIERMPHGLFRRLSSDRRLLGAFATAFLLAIGITSLSTFMEHLLLAQVVLAAGWAVFLVLLLFWYSYRRSLALINPLQQLKILVEDTRKELRIWDRRARRARPLLETGESPAIGSAPTEFTHDLARLEYFQVNQHWTRGATRAVRHAMSYARRYAEHGDHEVSSTALRAVTVINAEYIEAKGKTFFTDVLHWPDSQSHDAFIADSLEHMRQNLQAEISRRDEQQLEQTLQALAALVRLYQDIDYSMPHAEKTHAHLAAAYLANGVQAMAAHDMADVVLEGVRLMGLSARQFILQGSPNEAITLIRKIAMIGRTGCAKEAHRAVTMAAMAQFASLTFDLVRCKSGAIQFALEDTHKNAAQLSELFLKVPDPWPSNVHSTFLGPYYSLTSPDSLRMRLGTLVSELCESEADNEDAQPIVQNIKTWADCFWPATKNLLLAAVRERSHFTLVMIQWITGVTELLLVLSNAPACGRQTREDLRRHARRLIATYTWLPKDKETVTFVETCQLTEALFGTAMIARNQGCEDVAIEIGEHLLSWTFKGGKYVTGWGVLQRGLCACAALALMGDSDDVNNLKSSISACLQDERAPEPDALEHAVRGIRGRAASLPERGHWGSKIDSGISQVDHRTLAPLLDEMASMLKAGA